MALSIALVACGDDDDDDTGDTGSEATATETTDSGDTGDTGDEGEDGDSGDVAYDGTITFGDYGWDSAIVHNRVAQYVIEHGWGIETDSVAGETITLFQGLVNRDIDVSMEIWVDQQPQFEPEVEAGTIIDYGPNYPNSIQGWWVPTYMIEGDEERGIEPMTPDLQSVDDLPEYTDVFEDPEDPDKGRFYDCIAGWECQRVNESKFEFYGLNDSYNRFQPGSGAALATSLVSAYENGEPWLGYYWAPTWVFAVVDLTMIEEPEYTDECWEAIQDEEGNPTGEAGCAYPSVAVNKSANAEFADEAPEELLNFIDSYTTTMEQNNEFLLYMNDNDIQEHELAAIWFLKNNPEWKDWVPADIAEKVQADLDQESIPGE
ncbi:MAG: ABC transporter substrate-binding protein [Thermomicrobiales bacterium]